jgi:hypothetical protein
MSKLIGTNPNQVPSNADLGTAAFMDKKEFLLSKGSEMSAIEAVISKTAVDVFVYDTAKDSDGGAWRKRTQDTSWYNEKLNTLIRGSRQEFPSVAVIVATAASGGESKVIIYDADDPTLPMWMELSARGNSDTQGSTALGWYTSGTPQLTAVTALNGIVGVVGDGGLRQVKFVSDSFRLAYTTNSYITPVNIAQREIKDVISEGSGGTGGDIIVWYTTNDISMKVFPNAPIDASTGLHTPTIALGTDKGLSIIKDDGTVVNRSTSFINSSSPGGVHDISFDDNAGYWYTNCNLPPDHGNTSHAGILGHTPSIDTTGALSSSDGQNYAELMMAMGSNDGGTSTHWSSTTNPGVWMNHAGISTQANAGYMEITPHGDFANGYGLHKFLPDYSDHLASAVAYITSDYNTGWMNGAIKLATLSDTDTANAGAEIVTNGDFATDSDWSKGAGWTISGGKATHDSTTGNRYLTQGGILTAGKQYVLIFTISNYTSGVLRLYGATTQPIDITEGVATYTIHFIAATGGDVNFQSSVSGAFVGSISNVSCKLAEQDRSYNANGLQVFGTVPKTAVATGAELVAYGPFTTSNYIQQPYNSDLDFGTGDFMYSLWIYRNSLPTSTHERWFGTVASDGTERIDIFSNANTDNIAFFSVDGGATRGDIRITGIGIGVWHCLHFTRQGNVHKAYHNGELRGTNTGSATLANYGTDTDRRTHIGAAEHWDSGHAVLDGKIALAKISGTAPSAEQIAKMYNDEKYLFQENAKATLYGTSDAVTALAYDDSTELLHVGTSAGRSVFQGLRRVDNTTDAVGAAISASNGMVAGE